MIEEGLAHLRQYCMIGYQVSYILVGHHLVRNPPIQTHLSRTSTRFRNNNLSFLFPAPIPLSK